jgi:hypothetical protein
MAIELRCPDCGRQSDVPDRLAGKRARCKCGTEIRIPVEDPLLATLRATFAESSVGQPVRQETEPFPFGVRTESAIPANSAGTSDDPLAALGISLVEQPQRDGSLLVLSPEAVLPDRCVKCNAPANGQRHRVTLTWSHPATNLIQLALFCVFSVLWHSSHSAEIEVGICRRHLSRLRRKSALGGCLLVASLGMIAAGAIRGAEYGYVLLGGIVLLLASPIYLSLAGRLLTATRIEPRLIWIKGVCLEYLAELPERESNGNREKRSNIGP